MSAVAFAMTPAQVLMDGRLSRDARLLYAVLDLRQGQAASVRVRIATLATDLGASDKSVRRWMDELRAVGMVTTRQTGRSLILAVINVSRMASAARSVAGDRNGVSNAVTHAEQIAVTGDRSEPRSVTADQPDRSLVTALQIHNSQIQTSSSAPADPTPPPPAPPGADDDRSDQGYLAAIESATGHRLRAHHGIAQHLRAIRRSGITPADTAAIAAAYLAMHGGRVRKPAAWLATFVLESIAKGEGAEQLALWQEREISMAQWVTPLPPRIADLAVSEPCEHGEPRGRRGCALCRRMANQEPMMAGVA